MPSSFPSVNTSLKSDIAGSLVASPFVRGGARISSPPEIVFGVDHLTLSIRVEWCDQELFSRLESQKGLIQASSAESAPFRRKDRYEFDNLFSLNLHRTGIKFFAYHLSNADLQIMIANRPHDHALANCRISLGSMTCQDSVVHSYEQVLRWLSAIGGNVKDVQLSRIDLCADAIGTDIKTLDIPNQDRWITQARSFAAFYSNRRFTGAQFGRSEIVARIYDKQQEMVDKRSDSKQTFFWDKWQIEDENVPVTRVEFQLRREAILEMCDGTPADCISKLHQIWMYLTQDWLRQTEKPVDRKNNNQSHMRESEFWLKLFGWRDQEPINRNRKKVHINVNALRQQARGCLLSIAACLATEKQEFFGLISEITKIVQADLVSFMTDEADKFTRAFRGKLNRACLSI